MTSSRSPAESPEPTLADMAYRLAKTAAKDLRQIYVEGVRLFGPDQAAHYHAQLGAAFETLAAHPKLARERPEISPPVRVHSCGVHVVIYLAEAGGDVLILRVRHGREDWTNDSY